MGEGSQIDAGQEDRRRRGHPQEVGQGATGQGIQVTERDTGGSELRVNLGDLLQRPTS